ncbi:MAG: hypothetical protein EBZ48_03975, partial [Proteobacteria bacterium]|nr:hypothetical protein [Pseudomonadota bacterium]
MSTASLIAPEYIAVLSLVVVCMILTSFEELSLGSKKNKFCKSMRHHHMAILLGMFLSFLLGISTESTAAPSQRGFQVPVSVITGDLLDELKDTWKINLLRIQIGNNPIFDGKVGTEYNEMLEAEFQQLDAKLPLIAERGLNVTFVLFAP